MGTWLWNKNWVWHCLLIPLLAETAWHHVTPPWVELQLELPAAMKSGPEASRRCLPSSAVRTSPWAATSDHPLVPLPPARAPPKCRAALWPLRCCHQPFIHPTTVVPLLSNCANMDYTHRWVSDHLTPQNRFAQSLVCPSSPHQWAWPDLSEPPPPWSQSSHASVLGCQPRPRRPINYARL
jgi:hypothetical protein